MGKLIDLTGQRFGRLTVIERAEDYVSPKGKKFSTWECICDCGSKVSVGSNRLRRGLTKSCGCLRDEKRNAGNNMKHGLRYSRLYRIWSSMKNRCYLTKNKSYHNYGGRGIIICEEWLHDFKEFYDWAMANGYREDLSIERKNVDGPYSPENCCWVTSKEQDRNKRTNHYITIDGETMIVKDWCDRCGVNTWNFYKRLKAGWSPEEALGIKPRKN